MEPVMYFMSVEHKQKRQKARQDAQGNSVLLVPPPTFGINVISCISRLGLLVSYASLDFGPYLTDSYEVLNAEKRSLAYTRVGQGL